VQLVDVLVRDLVLVHLLHGDGLADLQSVRGVESEIQCRSFYKHVERYACVRDCDCRRKRRLLHVAANILQVKLRRTAHTLTSRPILTFFGMRPKGMPRRPKKMGMPSLNLCCSQLRKPAYKGVEESQMA
jgi:hypothetical protein